ncbi:hypothetical protein E2562_038551 [Oryza meyeriana var. granulata]|uniref:KIB1-4 beta-propeller domain-containing protein n=1 Tax=Oryza meyeriana var. granulata TaxID=110450 RepID=A0A6G1F287_9ORYZ|nr:hypothetical protein E2562_038551 [Oryza meyeriana var. granulata]
MLMYSISEEEIVSAADTPAVVADKDTEEFRAASTRTKNTIPAIAAVGGKLRFIFRESNQSKMCTIQLDFSPDRPPIAEFDELDEVDAKVALPEGIQSGDVWLLESDDELFQVYVCFLDFDDRKIGAVAVYRMDLSDELPAWRAVRDIGDRVFLLAGGVAATSCCASTCNLKRNRIYFMKNFRENDGDLCIYDLDEQTLDIIRVHDRHLDLKAH